jgi:TonB family protein
MSEAVSDIIVARSRQPDGLMKMVVWSVGIHAAAVAGILFMPQRPVDDAPRTVMTISLGGAPGPKTDGLTQIGGRSVQAVAEETARIDPPPAPVRPKMALPDPKAKPRTRPERPRPKQAPAESNARTLSTGEKPIEGSTRSETRVRGQGFGLSSAGGAGGEVTVDAENFCCQEYLNQMVTEIHRNWIQSQGQPGITKMKFTIRRDGTLDQIQLERPSGFVKLDQASERALRLTRLMPLPNQYPNQTLTVHMSFEYQP